MAPRHGMVRLWAVALATTLLVGCPAAPSVVSDGDNANIIPDTRGGGVGRPISFSGGTDAGSGGGSGQTLPFSCTAPRAGVGGASDPITGSNPSSLSPSSGTSVSPLYLNNGDVSISLSGAKTAVAAIASVRTIGTSGLTAAWGGTAFGAAFRIQVAPFASRAETAQERTERLAAEYAKRLKPAAQGYHTQATATQFAVSDARTFKIIDFDTQQVASVPTHAVYVNSVASGQRGGFVIWVDDQDASIFQGANSPLNTIVTELRDHIYPTDTCAFGPDTLVSENNALPADKRVALNDDYVHFVFSHNVDKGTLTSGNGTLGFFTLADLTPGESAANNSKILYIASSATSRSLNDVFAVVAHEFQHCLFSLHRAKTVGFANHLNEFNSGKDTWMNEGQSMLAMLLNGYGPDGKSPSPSILMQIAEYLNGGQQNPGGPERYSMTDFYSQNGNPSDAYGMVTLFFQYLDDRLGDGILKELHSTDNSATMYGGGAAAPTSVDPIDLVNTVLRAHGTSLAQVFPDFAAALALDGTSALAGLSPDQAARFQISNVNLRGKGYQGVGGTVNLNGPSAMNDLSKALTLKPFSVGLMSQGNLASSFNFRATGINGGSSLAAKLILQK